METSPYNYDRIQPWTPQQNQLYQNGPVAQNEPQLIQSQHQKLPQRGTGQKPGMQAKMPKARALALANSLKRSLAVASIIGFGMFGGLVAMHQVSTTTTQSTQSAKSTSGSSHTSSNSNSSSQNSNSFFNQQGGNTSGTSSSTSNSSSSNNTTSTPVTGTSTS